jgi:hypothetical protein
MVDLAHEEAQPFLLLFAFGNILHGADDTHGSPPMSGTLEMNKSLHFHPADLGVSPLNPILMCGALRSGRMERCLAVRPKPFGVVWMHQLLQIFDRQHIRRNIENLSKTSIPRTHLGEHIVSPPPELGCVEGQLQTIFARLYLLAFDCKAHPANDEHQVSCHRAKRQQVRQCARVFNAESPAWRQQEEIGRSSAEHGAKKAWAEPANQRYEYNCGRIRNELDALKIWVESEPQHRGNPNGQESKGIGTYGARPQRGNINVE